MIELEKNATIIRLQATSGNKSSFNTITASVECTRQPLDDGKASLFGGSFGKMFVIYFEVNANVKEGDKIKIGNEYYRVESGGVNKRDDGIIADYLSVVVSRIDD